MFTVLCAQALLAKIKQLQDSYLQESRYIKPLSYARCSAVVKRMEHRKLVLILLLFSLHLQTVHPFFLRFYPFFKLFHHHPYHHHYPHHKVVKLVTYYEDPGYSYHHSSSYGHHHKPLSSYGDVDRIDTDESYDTNR